MPPTLLPGSRLLLCGLLLVPAAARAQAAPAPPPPRHEGRADFSFVGTTGNASTQAVGLNVEHLVRPTGWEIGAKAGYVRNHAGDTLTAQSLTIGLGAARAVNARVGIIARYGFLRDEFAGTSGRNTIDGGITLKIVATARHIFGVDATAGYAHESRLAGPELSGATAAAGARYVVKLSDTADLSEDVRVLSSLSGEDDRRVTNVIALTAKVTTVFSLKLSNTIRYVNAPPVGFKRTDTITSIAIVAKY